MTEIPEHLRKRAEEARAKAAAAKAGGAGDAAAPRPAAARPRPPQSRGRQASPRTCSSGRRPPRPRPRAARPRRRTAVATAGRRGAAATAAAAPPLATGPGGHTQRLLTVVKSGSIQDVKATPQDKVHVWPHLLVVEFVAALAITAFLLVFSVVRQRPAARAGQRQPDAEPVQGARGTSSACRSC